MLTSRTRAAVFGASAVVAAGAFATGMSLSATGQGNPVEDFGRASCVIDAAGTCTVSHKLGVVPTAVLVSPDTPGQFNGFMLNTVHDSLTATSFRVRAMFDATTPKAGGQIWFTYWARRTGDPVPPTKTPTSPTKPTVTPTVPRRNRLFLRLKPPRPLPNSQPRQALRHPRSRHRPRGHSRQSPDFPTVSEGS